MLLHQLRPRLVRRLVRTSSSLPIALRLGHPVADRSNGVGCAQLPGPGNPHTSV